MTEDGEAIAEGFRLHTPVTCKLVGKRLAAARCSLGISARQVAVAIRARDAQYARFEAGEESMTLEQLIRAAAELDVAVSELVK